MNVDHILSTLSGEGVEFLLIGGMNFLLRHKPVLTYDVDVWIEDSAENRRRCEAALAMLDAEWGRDDSDWTPVAEKPSGWLEAQSVYCLNSPHGAIDVFRRVAGLSDWRESKAKAFHAKTASGAEYFGLADSDMLACQLALDENIRKHDRIATLREALGHE